MFLLVKLVDATLLHKDLLRAQDVAFCRGLSRPCANICPAAHVGASQLPYRGTSIGQISRPPNLLNNSACLQTITYKTCTACIRRHRKLSWRSSSKGLHRRHLSSAAWMLRKETSCAENVRLILRTSSVIQASEESGVSERDPPGRPIMTGQSVCSFAKVSGSTHFVTARCMPSTTA